MKNRSMILPLLILCFTMGFSGICAGEDLKTALTVKKITFTRDKGGREKIVIFCNQSCVPELRSLEGENPRVVMDMKGVHRIRTKSPNVATGGKLVKRIRSYLDRQTKTLRIALDLEPSKYYVVRPMQDPPGNRYTVTIYEAASLSVQRPAGKTDTKGPRLTPDQRIYIYQSDLKPKAQQEDMPLAAAPGPETPREAKAVEDVPSADTGRSQLNAGEFAAAVDTFTRIIAAHPKDSLGYRLRGNAYDNLGDRRKAVEDWVKAARLGDAAIQSYLDFLQVAWRENPAQ